MTDYKQEIEDIAEEYIDRFASTCLDCEHPICLRHKKSFTQALTHLINKAREIYVPIHGTEGRYEVSNLGNVKSVAGGRRKGGILKQSIRSKKVGYPCITLYKGKKTQVENVHGLVARAFISNPDSKPCINHIDGNKLNNCADNLEWVDYSENSIHAHHILGKVPWNKGRFGIPAHKPRQDRIKELEQ